MVSFNLHEGMTADQILSELKGRTSGESRQELVQFFTKNTIDDVPLASHQILKATEEYAVVLNRRMWKNSLGILYIQNDYYLVGVNDEGKYFAHIVTANISTQPWEKQPSTIDMEALLSWLNRTAEGYSLRVQGDLLLRFLPHSTTTLAARSPGESFEIALPTNSAGPRNILAERTTPPLKRIRVGNHEVSTDGELLLSRYGGEHLVATGRSLVLQHPEHGIKTLEIPKGHFAVLTGQQGRYLSIRPESSSGFD